MKTLEPKTATQYKLLVQDEVNKYCQTVAPIAKDSEYLQVLQGNTERLQGSLVLAGYELLGGEDEQMIVRAALAIELLHAYTRCMEQGVDAERVLRAQHEAQIILANLETDEENRLKALSITNRTLMLATLARLPETSEEDALQWRATELTLNPLHVGQVLAGADCHATNTVTPGAISLGKDLLQGKTPNLEKYLTELQKTRATIREQ
jgi:hypothetical protein